MVIVFGYATVWQRVEAAAPRNKRSLVDITQWMLSRKSSWSVGGYKQVLTSPTNKLFTSTNPTHKTDHKGPLFNHLFYFLSVLQLMEQVCTCSISTAKNLHFHSQK